MSQIAAISRRVRFGLVVIVASILACVGVILSLDLLPGLLALFGLPAGLEPDAAAFSLPVGPDFGIGDLLLIVGGYAPLRALALDYVSG